MLVIKRPFIWWAGWTIVALRLFLPPVAVAQVTAPSPAGVAEVERVVVTGSNIPTAEEIGPNPVDTYRPQDIEKLGIRNATDLQTFLPQEAGSTVNLHMSNGDGTVQSTCAVSGHPRKPWCW